MMTGAAQSSWSRPRTSSCTSTTTTTSPYSGSASPRGRGRPPAAGVDRGRDPEPCAARVGQTVVCGGPMRRPVRKPWFIAAVVAAGALVLAAHLAADRADREPPNYALVE